jgi:two-component system chemotaxis response regulator CheY
VSILIVEDNPVNALLLERFLKKGGYCTLLARTAKAALASLTSTNDIQLIVTDLNMPDMDGLELIAKIRKTAPFNHLPIIVVSAQSQVGTVQMANSLGCNAFLAKPVDKVTLLNRVQALLKQHPLVLQSKHHVMNNLGLVAQEYDDLVKTFVTQLGTAMPIVIAEQADSGESISENLGRLLQELAESARILGAEQYTVLYSKLNTQRSITRAECRTVLEALQNLESALGTASQPSQQSEALT